MKNILSFNDNSFRLKALRKRIKHSSKLKNIYKKCRTEGNWSDYKTQRNSCVSLFCKTKAEYFHKLNVKDLPGIKKFWKTIKPHFSDKDLNSNKLMLKEKNGPITEKKQLATVMKTFSVSVIEGLDKKKGNDPPLNSINYQNINDVLEKFKNHASVRKIRQTIMTDEKFAKRKMI